MYKRNLRTKLARKRRNAVQVGAYVHETDPVVKCPSVQEMYWIMSDTIAIVGAGQVAVQACESLRKLGHTGRVVVVGDEHAVPYQRPPLSKKYLSGDFPAERLALKPAAFFESHSIDLRLGVRVTGLDLSAHRLDLANGEHVEYDRLLLATGSTPRRLSVPGHGLKGIHYLRTRGDVEAIRRELADARQVVIIGAGYIGLEVAATCRTLGLSVDVIEMSDRVMNRVVAPEISAFYTDEHQRAGVRIHTRTVLSRFVPSAADPERVGTVTTLDGPQFPADLVIVGVGVVPEIDLAEKAGLACENGIAVDEHARTSDPNVYAAGDCANHPSLRYGRRVRLESVDNAFEQAKVAAENMLGGRAIHDRVPWFWSDQYDLKLLITGLNFDYDRALIRGNTNDRSFSCCYLQGTELLAMDCVNRAKDYMAAKKLIAERAHFDLERLADPNIPLAEAIRR
jgi:3-phenylpropionate/trans-cinnamate dioxygenase ferredoxin reductase subunit